MPVSDQRKLVARLTGRVECPPPRRLRPLSPGLVGEFGGQVGRQVRVLAETHRLERDLKRLLMTVDVPVIAQVIASCVGPYSP